MSVVVLRTIFLYAAIVFSLRIMGKRQLGELEPAELVVTILVSNIATLSIEDTNVPLLGSILPIFTLVSCEVLVSVLTTKNSRVRKLISGNPLIVIRDGMIDQKVLKDVRWSIEDLIEQLRLNNMFDISEVALAIVETSGALSAYPKFSARPATAQMMNVEQAGEPDAPPMLVISDGRLVPDALQFCNLREEWVHKILREQKLKVEDVFLMTCDRRARYSIQKRQVATSE